MVLTWTISDRGNETEDAMAMCSFVQRVRGSLRSDVEVEKYMFGEDDILPWCWRFLAWQHIVRHLNTESLSFTSFSLFHNQCKL